VQLLRTIAHYDDLLTRDPVAYKTEELAHIHGVTSRFVGIRLFDVALAVVGAAIALYAQRRRRRTTQGVGIGIAVHGLLLFALESRNAAHAQTYEAHLVDFTPPTPPR